MTAGHCRTCTCREASLALSEEEMLAKMRIACNEKGIAVNWDDTVSERDAGQLLNRSQNTLRLWRATDRRLEFMQNGNRPRYLLAVLARYLVARKNIDD